MDKIKVDGAFFYNSIPTAFKKAVEKFGEAELKYWKDCLRKKIYNKSFGEGKLILGEILAEKISFDGEEWFRLDFEINAGLFRVYRYFNDEDGTILLHDKLHSPEQWFSRDFHEYTALLEDYDVEISFNYRE